MYKQPPKRQQVVRRAIVYSVMSVAVAVLVTILIFVMLGYQFNRTDGRIEQGGLVQFSTRPTGASVNIDGNNLGATTTTKSTLASGEHHIRMERANYKPWQKTVQVVPGSILWLNYARLVPNNLEQSNIERFSTVSGTAVSPNDRWMAIHEKKNSPAITLADLGEVTPEMTEIEIPESAYTKPEKESSSVFTLERWDPRSRYLLVLHTYDDNQKEWLVVDTEDEDNTKNISRPFNLDIKKPIFHGGDSTLIYALTDDNDVRKIDLDASTVSGVLVSNIAEFKVHDRATLVYATTYDKEAKERSVGYYQDGADEPVPLRTFKNDDGKTPLHIDIGEYFSDFYVSLSYGKELEVLKTASLPKIDEDVNEVLTPVTGITTKQPITDLTVRTGGRFTVAQNGETVTVYDAELQKTTNTKLKGDSPVREEPEWLDNYMLWSDRDGTLRTYEFDGANQHDIMPVVEGFDATLSPNSTFMYGITKDDKGWHLSRVRMILD